MCTVGECFRAGIRAPFLIMLRVGAAPCADEAWRASLGYEPGPLPTAGGPMSRIVLTSRQLAMALGEDQSGEAFSAPIGSDCSRPNRLSR